MNSFRVQQRNPCPIAWNIANSFSWQLDLAMGWKVDCAFYGALLECVGNCSWIVNWFGDRCSAL